MSNAVVLCAVDERRIATVTLNRPHVNNAYNAELVAALIETFGALREDESLRAVVIRGNGPHFQAGADLRWLDEIARMDPAANVATSTRTAAAVRGLNEMPMPVIALVHGACIGGGTGIVAAADIVIASSDAIFAISEARWGVFASIIFPQLNAAIGARQVRRYAVTCERFDAEQARVLGLVHEVCAPGGLDEAAAPILDGILRAGPRAVRATKRSVMSCAGQFMSDGQFDELVQLHADVRQSAEAREGFSSFREKREPGWYPVARS
ncbi:MAG: enoyl-CoA hydratase-related protein [Gammaproteobacteria bacterium]|jgi:methylglutaconyl-CoA hydratase